MIELEVVLPITHTTGKTMDSNGVAVPNVLLTNEQPIFFEGWNYYMDNITTTRFIGNRGMVEVVNAQLVAKTGMCFHAGIRRGFI